MIAVLRRTLREILSATFPRTWERLSAWRRVRRERKSWKVRIAEVVACKDNALLPRVTGAGEIHDGYQIMHNGLKVLVDGYYGEDITRMLQLNRGSHEPQEEIVFDAIVRSLPAGAVMIEAGAYWGFYSMWFMQAIKNASVYLIEPEFANLEVGKKNFSVNHIRGDFTHAYVGSEPGVHADGTPIVSIASLFAEKNLSHVSLLHVDVQGFELALLEGARTQIQTCLVDYVFISTHSPVLHLQCLNFLEQRQWRVLVSIGLEETCSADGIIVACGPHISPPPFNPPSKKGHR